MQLEAVPARLPRPEFRSGYRSLVATTSAKKKRDPTRRPRRMHWRLPIRRTGSTMNIQPLMQ